MVFCFLFSVTGRWDKFSHESIRPSRRWNGYKYSQVAIWRNGILYNRLFFLLPVSRQFAFVDLTTYLYHVPWLAAEPYRNVTTPLTHALLQLSPYVETISLRMGAPAEIDTAHIKSTALKDLLNLLEGVCNPTSAVSPLALTAT